MRKLSIGIITGLLLGGLAPSLASAQDQRDEVYVSISTAQLYGVQVPNTKVVSKAEHNPTVFCEAPHTGQLSWFADEQCRGNQQAHAITWDGSFEACQNNFTGKLRRAATCTPNEKPVVI